MNCDVNEDSLNCNTINIRQMAVWADYVTGSSVTKRRSAAHAHCCGCSSWRKMEVYVRAPMFGFANWIFPQDSVVREVLDRFVQKQVGFLYRTG